MKLYQNKYLTYSLKDVYYNHRNKIKNNNTGAREAKNGCGLTPVEGCVDVKQYRKMEGIG